VNSCIRCKQLDVLIIDLSDTQVSSTEKNSSIDHISLIEDANNRKPSFLEKIRSFTLGENKETVSGEGTV
jgi:hypothetical protein